MTLRPYLSRRALATALATSAALAVAAPARADVSSWLSVGGGYTLRRDAVRDSLHDRGAFSTAVGVGSSPHGRVVVGGLFRLATSFALGTDAGLFTRVASRGFAQGDWGLALDLGVSGRFWKDGRFGRWPVQALVVGGAPWGLNLAVGADIVDLGGQSGIAGGLALLEIDLLRLTVMRQGSSDRIWENPAPAGGREAASR